MIETMVTTMVMMGNPRGPSPSVEIGVAVRPPRV